MRRKSGSSIDIEEIITNSLHHLVMVDILYGLSVSFALSYVGEVHTQKQTFVFANRWWYSFCSFVDTRIYPYSLPLTSFIVFSPLSMY